MDRGVFDWSRWRRILPFRQFEEEGVLRLDLLSLRSSLLHMREEVVAEREEQRSKEVQDLWHIGCTVLRGYEFGNECIEMIGILAYFHPTALNALIFTNQDLVMMLNDLGFLTSTLIQDNTTSYTLISTKFPALIHEIRQKNLQDEVQFLRKIIGLLMSCKPRLESYSWHWHDAMTPIWKHALTHSHGIRFIREYEQAWEDYLEDLLQSEYNRFNDEEKEVLNQALEIFCVEYGDMGWKTMELRFTQFRLYLRENQDLGTNEDVETLLHHSRHYRPLLERYAIVNHLIAGYVNDSSDYDSKQHHISESMYKNALEMDDVNSKTLLLQEALAYSVIGYNVWRSTIPDKDGDLCLAVRLQCLYELGRCDEMLAYMSEIREILMRHPFSPDMCWFPTYVFKSTRGMERNASEMILNELSIFLNHFYKMGGTGFHENEYMLECLIKCEGGLANWGRILEIVREKKELCSAHIGGHPGGIGVSLGFELTLFNFVRNSTDGLVDEVVNESLEFTKLFVEFFLNDGAYGEKYTVDMPLFLKYDPLVHVITILLVKSRHDELLSYMSEYEKLLEEKYGDRIGPVTIGMLLFGEWLTNQLESQMNIGNKLEELVQGVKSMTRNRMSIISKHPAEMEPWMEVYAHLISTKCDSYLAQI